METDSMQKQQLDYIFQYCLIDLSKNVNKIGHSLYLCWMSSVIRFSIQKILQTCLDPYLLVTTRTEILINFHLPLLLAPSTGKALISPIQAPVQGGNCDTWSQNQNFPGISFMVPHRGDLFFISMLCVWSNLSYHIYNKLHPLVATCYWRGHMLFEASAMPMPAGSWVAGAIWFWRNFSTARHLTVMGFFSWNPAFNQKYRHTPPKFNSPPNEKNHFPTIIFQGDFGCLTSFYVVWGKKITWFPGWSKVMRIEIIDWFDIYI